MNQHDYEQIARELWADFDELTDLNGSYSGVSLKNRAIGVKKATLAAIHMILLEMNDLRKIDPKDLEKELNSKYRFWRNVNKEMLKL